MKKSRYSLQQIAKILKKSDNGKTAIECSCESIKPLLSVELKMSGLKKDVVIQ